MYLSQDSVHSRQNSIVGNLGEHEKDILHDGGMEFKEGS